MPGSKVELYAAIRRDAREAGPSSRALALKYSVGRRTVALALESAWPTARKRMPPRGSRLDPYKLAIGGMLQADLDAPGKQRHTLTRIFHRLLDEYGAEEVSYAMVRDYVYDRRRETRVEECRGPLASFIPQSHRPGDEAQVVFGNVGINLACTLPKCFLFSLRFSYSGRSVHKISRPAICWSSSGTARTTTAGSDSAPKTIEDRRGRAPWNSYARAVTGCCWFLSGSSPYRSPSRWRCGPAVGGCTSARRSTKGYLPRAGCWMPTCYRETRAGRAYSTP